MSGPGTIQRVAIGSLNPVKIAAAEAVVRTRYPIAEVLAAPAPSGVAAQPLSDADMVAGAKSRAVAVRRGLDADLGIGLEGGVQPSPWGLLLTSWAAIVDRSGRVGLGSSGRLVLPPALADALATGEELGPAMDRLASLHDTRRGPGSVGILTGGLVAREDSFRVAIAYALAPFIHPAWYGARAAPAE